jgi:hypothetical protein
MSHQFQGASCPVSFLYGLLTGLGRKQKGSDLFSTPQIGLLSEYTSGQDVAFTWTIRRKMTGNSPSLLLLGYSHGDRTTSPSESGRAMSRALVTTWSTGLFRRTGLGEWCLRFSRE